MYEGFIVVIHAATVTLIVWQWRTIVQLRDQLWARDKALAYERLHHCEAIAGIVQQAERLDDLYRLRMKLTEISPNHPTPAA